MNAAPDFQLEGKRAIVTGGANGIGRAICLALGQAGADVFITARADQSALEDTVAELHRLGRNAGGILQEADETGAPRRVLDAAQSCVGPVDILVNNAATAQRTPFLDMGEAEYDRTLSVNLRFPFFLLQAFAADLVARGAPGAVINVASVSAFKAISRLSAYQCSKAALSMLTKGAAYELAAHGIRVNTLSPGLTATKANQDQWALDPDTWRERGAHLPLGRAGIPQDFAGAAVFLASDASAWMTGADIVIDGGDSVI